MTKKIRRIALPMTLAPIVSTWAILASAQPGGSGQGDESVGQKYANLISYDVDVAKWLPEGSTPPADGYTAKGSTIKITPLLDIDKIPGAFYMDFNWMGKGYSEDYLDAGEHFSDFDEVIGFIGTKGGLKDPHELGGEMEIWLGGEKHLITKSCLIFIPKGLKHCPLRFNRIDDPILFFSVGMTDSYSSTPSTVTDP